MNFGVVVTKQQHGELAMSLLEAASKRGWNLRCFLTDEGVKMYNHPRYREYCKGDNWLALCEMSLERYHIEQTAVASEAPEIIIGGQYQDAELVRNSDRVVVF